MLETTTACFLHTRRAASRCISWLGSVAQLGERLVRTAAVSGSISFSSTSRGIEGATADRATRLLCLVGYAPDGFSGIVGDEQTSVLGDGEPGRPSPDAGRRTRRTGAVPESGDKI